MRPRSYTVPLVVLGVVLFGLLTAIAVVAGVRVGAAEAAPCPVGTWRVVSYEETIDLGALGSVRFDGGRDVTLVLGADGAASTDYGTATAYEGRSEGGHAVRLVLTGRSDFRYVAAGGRLSVSDVRSAPTAVVLVDEVQRGDPVPLRTMAGSYAYRCAQDELVQSDGDRLTVVYRRA
jgi:hypothetical protein